MKYPIKKNSVQETLIVPLYGRKMCSERFPALFRDETAIRLIERVDYDFRCRRRSLKARCSSSGFLRSPCGKMIWRGKCATI